VSGSRGGNPLEHIEDTQGSEAFGAYLRKLRETRRLSLDAVEELSAAFPEKVTKSHLSRIENGLALPTFPRLMAMSQIYGMPIASLAERYELELRRSMKPIDLNDKTDESVLREFEGLFYSGDFHEALILVWALTDRVRAAGGSADAVVELKLKIIVCLMKLGRYEYAKSQCEEILSGPKLHEATRLRALQLFANACFRLQLHDVALLALDACEQGAHHVGGSGRFRADVLALRGNLHQNAARPGDALAAYEKALEIYSAAGEAYEVLTVRLNMAVAETDCARLDRARDMLEALLLVLEAGQHERLRAQALSHLAVIHFRNKRLDAAEGFAIKSNAIARPREYTAIVFRNCFYLWKIARSRKDDGAVRLNERTLKSYLARIEESLPELDEFRRITAGDQS
jgi:transcriptional regulator with XRE-family HTH domain/predicted negative regulator of RcsB-dependent stress response